VLAASDFSTCKYRGFQISNSESLCLHTHLCDCLPCFCIAIAGYAGAEDDSDGDEDYEEDDGNMTLPASVMKRVVALKELQDKRTAVFDEYKVCLFEQVLSLMAHWF
jgi:hypothetical protein